jgi:hypothetical protein
MCVFDGTVGHHAADYCHEFFPTNLVATTEFAEAVAAADKGDTASSKTAMSKALTKVSCPCLPRALARRYACRGKPAARFIA